MSIDVRRVDLEFLRSITTTDIYDFLFYTDRERGNKSAARARKLVAIKGLFKYLTSKRQLLDYDPSVAIDAPNKRKSLPKFLTLDESRLLLEIGKDRHVVGIPPDVIFAIVTLFLNCGMRLSELCGMNLSDLDRYLRSARIVGKGNKERIVYLNEACRAALGDYIAERTAAPLSRKPPQTKMHFF